MRLRRLFLTLILLGWLAPLLAPRQAHAQQKARVLVFLRTDCPICNRYAPEIQRIAREYRDQAGFGLVFADKSESERAIRGYVKTFGYSLPVLRDPQRRLVSLAHARVTPEVAVFDAGGALAYHGRIDNLFVSFGKARSAATTHDLQDALHAVTNHERVAVAETQAVGCYLADAQ